MDASVETAVTPFVIIHGDKNIHLEEDGEEFRTKNTTLYVNVMDFYSRP